MWWGCAVEPVGTCLVQLTAVAPQPVPAVSLSRQVCPMSGRTNSVSYSPGYAPIGEVRDMRGRGGEEGGAGTGQWAAPPHRYGRKRPLSNIAKLIHMRKCKRYTIFCQIHWLNPWFRFIQPENFLKITHVLNLNFVSATAFCFAQQLYRPICLYVCLFVVLCGLKITSTYDLTNQLIWIIIIYIKMGHYMALEP